MTNVQRTSDMVHVTRCHGCAHYDPETRMCAMWEQKTAQTEFCSRGMRVKEEKHE